jgi:hypothetical protein
MTKLTISRVVETSKILATETGKEIRDFIEYVAEVCEQCLRCLRNGLTFQDNINCLIKTIQVTHLKAQSVDTDGRTPFGVLSVRTTSASNIGLDSFEWHIGSDGSLQVTAGFVGGTASTTAQITLVVLFQ